MSDPHYAVAFYRETIGWPLRFESAELGWAEFDLGGAALAVERGVPERGH
jgi:hypothetical protein